MDKFTEVLNSDAVQLFADGVQSALAKLGDGAMYVAEVFIRQQIVVGAQLAGTGIAMVIALTVIGKVIYKKTQDKKLDEWQRRSWSDGMMAFWITATILGFVAMGLIISSFGYFINPDYYAIKEVMRMLDLGTNY